MNRKFKNKYRTSSARLPHWDYSQNAAYFVTICTHDRICYFGKVEQGYVRLSSIGRIVRSEWLKTPEIRPDMNIKLDAFVVMPNHFHGIIIIGENEFNKLINPHHGRDAMHRVFSNQFGPQRKNLASIIRGFKSAVTKHARNLNADFRWQSRYYDHIIRNELSYNRIVTYIQQNPLKWQEDRYFETRR